MATTDKCLNPIGGGVSNTITSVQKDNLVVEYIAQPIKRERTEEEKLRRHLHGDKGAKFSSRQMSIRKDGVMGAITTVTEKDNLIMEAMIQTKPKGKGWKEFTDKDGKKGWYRLRKLTPRECFRLQDVDEDKIDTMMSAGISDSQCYKLAGNSITTKVMEEIFRNLFSIEEEDHTTLF